MLKKRLHPIIPSERSNKIRPNFTPDSMPQELYIEDPAKENALEQNPTQRPEVDAPSVPSSWEIEMLRKENVFLREELAKKDKMLESTINRLDRAISRLEAVTVKINEESSISNLPVQDGSQASSSNTPDRCAPMNGQITLANGEVVCQKKLRTLRSIS